MTLGSFEKQWLLLAARCITERKFGVFLYVINGLSRGIRLNGYIVENAPALTLSRISRMIKKHKNQTVGSKMTLYQYLTGASAKLTRAAMSLLCP